MNAFDRSRLRAAGTLIAIVAILYAAGIRFFASDGYLLIGAVAVLLVAVGGLFYAWDRS